MAIFTGGVFECGTGMNSLCDKRGISLHRVSGHRSGRGSVIAHSYNYSENKKGAKKEPTKPSGLRKGASTWWLPLFGWSPDQKWAEEEKEEEEEEDKKTVESVQTVQHSKDLKKSDEKIEKRRSKSVPVCFTAEKAKILRKTLRSTEAFHDLMYHSAIASRLASPDSSEEEEEEESRKGKG